MELRKFSNVNAAIAYAIICSAVFLSGCVSETLSTANTQPINANNQAQQGSYDPIQRAEAVAQIREKAANANSGELTNAYVAADGPNEPPSPEVSAVKIEKLQQVADQNAASNSDSELAQKQRQIRELQQKARTHYGAAVDAIEN